MTNVFIEPQPDRLYRVTRSSHNVTVHLPTCRHLKLAQHGVPWNWAEGRTLAEVFRVPWNRPCETCLAPVARAHGGIWGLAYVVDGKVQH